MYPPELVKPMKDELTTVGFKELLSAQDVDNALTQDGTALVLVNSVCGCAEANARPGAKMAVDHDKTPENLYTVFAGVDTEATDKARSYMVPFPPSSPSIALFKDGELVHMLERHHIEGRPAEMIADNLKATFDEHC
ncbi:BrxA/BrxB family bacilliredoxin [Flavobacterium sp. CS20]|uniref:BrxA/BrxB family bacilliredoxin n=1 Tax=Flavobacterium sp. CS20 TaxID=2775246 RepID=UPI001B3A5736|nr:BrxA/BrxB family bacilliredoxin [Flavobacterium sp. CS20]QTY26117.1 BrxA/BrxB family bacilliredoxin [Flavobacterium sp. CS20]